MIQRRDALLLAMLLCNICIYTAQPPTDENNKKSRKSWAKAITYYVGIPLAGATVWKSLSSFRGRQQQPPSHEQPVPVPNRNISNSTPDKRILSQSPPVTPPLAPASIASAAPDSSPQFSAESRPMLSIAPTERKQELHPNEKPLPDDRPLNVSPVVPQYQDQQALLQQRILKRRLEIYEKIDPSAGWAMSSMNMEARLDYIDKLHQKTQNEINQYIKDKARKNWKSVITKVKKSSQKNKQAMTTTNASSIPDHPSAVENFGSGEKQSAAVPPAGMIISGRLSTTVLDQTSWATVSAINYFLPQLRHYLRPNPRSGIQPTVSFSFDLTNPELRSNLKHLVESGRLDEDTTFILRELLQNSQFVTVEIPSGYVAVTSASMIQADQALDESA